MFYYHDGTTGIVYNGTGDGDSDPNRDGSLGDAPDCNLEGDPVNTSTGNATCTSTDLALPGRGLALTFTRTYNSQDVDRSGFLGRGWICEYQAALEFPSSTTVTFVAADGRRETFVSNGDGTYESPSGVTERLYANPDGSYTLLHLDQSRLGFDSGGHLATMLDRYGNSITLTYSSTGQLTGVAETGGRSLSFCLASQ